MVIRLGVFEVELETGELRKAGASRIRLQEQPRKVLAALVERPGELVTRQALRERLWPNDLHVDYDHGIAKAVCRLRMVLGDSASSPRFIETVPRHGYRLLVRAEPVAPTARPSGLRRRGVEILLVAALGASVAFAVALGALEPREKTALDPAPASEPMSIAVLPFRSMERDDRRLTLSLGMTDTLITRLSRSTGLSVRPTSAVAGFVEDGVDVLDAGQRLDVDAVLAGAYQREGERFRVSLRLVCVGDARTLWAEVFDEETTSVFELQDRVSKRVVTGLSPGLFHDPGTRACRTE